MLHRTNFLSPSKVQTKIIKYFSVFLVIALISLEISTGFLIFENPTITEVRTNFDDFTFSNISVAFYTIAGSSQKAPDPDLRGRFWEPQLKFFHFNFSLHYLSDGPLQVNGVNFMVLPNGSTSYRDKQLCIRTPESWRHFIKYNLDKKWYFRGTHDTYINMAEFVKFVEELEEYGDPMTTINMAYNFHEWNNTYYPHGGSGFLFSNYAMRKFYENIDLYEELCYQTFDDVALTPFFNKLGINLTEFQTNKFVVTWPNSEFDMNLIVLQRYKEVKMLKLCPPYYKLYSDGQELYPGQASKAASIHMHRIRMNESRLLIDLTPLNYGIFFEDPNTPHFCTLSSVPE